MHDQLTNISFIDAIRLAQERILIANPNAFLIGEGVPDPKAIFGTTKGLKDKFPAKVFDSPVSENGVTGVCLGAALNGMLPIMTFQRIDFAMYAMDQIINNVAKWRSMFNHKKPIPFIMRMTVGRGWGQGNQHSQNLEALFSHIPGLRVVVPYDPISAYDLLIEASRADDPTVFIEHRWLHNMKAKEPITSPNVYGNRKLTIVSWGPAADLCLHHRHDCTLFRLYRLNPLKIDHVIESVKKTKNLLVVSDDWKSCGVASEIITRCAEEISNINVKRITCPDYYVPSSQFRSDNFYPNATQITKAIEEMLDIELEMPKDNGIPHDVDPYLGRVTSLI